MLEVDKVDVSYGSLQALWQVSLRVNKGEIVAIIGHNGAGKTTILKTISGLLRPSSGEIKLNGERIDTLPSFAIAERGIGHIPEGRRLFPFMTVLENLKIGAYIPRAWKRKNETLKWIFQLFPILEMRKKQLSGTLSGGEQQMLAIARGLMCNPQLLMLDEPSTGLAPKLVLKALEVIKQLNDEGMTILLVEQNVANALELADRVYVIEEGRTVLEGKGRELMGDIRIKKAYLGI